MNLARCSMLGLGLLSALAAVPVRALDFRSVAEPAVLQDGPAAKGKPRYVIARATPVELVFDAEGWSKVRDSSGDMTWIETRFLSPRRTVMIRAERAQVRSQPDDKAALVFEAEKDVVLDLQEAASAGWAKVRHRGGQSGYVRALQVWGL
ncbi:hypothetical protein B9N43_10890 [Denitratisoma sp. DHT3]|uniref:SH3 domain-containing protein n=1 Tax=Denitratisoma sp. DHT3 TaxID=1981880 RepID=UPI0011982D13|nr:SH3 domain-containing protein [Denitratisoma sp. DHT3]QDX81716.1 hypothetical protein B9N43_10890 [Denitratisoma sp. DHT3]